MGVGYRVPFFILQEVGSGLNEMGYYRGTRVAVKVENPEIGGYKDLLCVKVGSCACNKIFCRERLVHVLAKRMDCIWPVNCRRIQTKK